jgi:hypothetical protein
MAVIKLSVTTGANRLSGQAIANHFQKTILVG